METNFDPPKLAGELTKSVTFCGPRTSPHHPSPTRRSAVTIFQPASKCCKNKTLKCKASSSGWRMLCERYTGDEGIQAFIFHISYKSTRANGQKVAKGALLLFQR